jgi:putative iron-only hydrogenase system regulator
MFKPAVRVRPDPREHVDIRCSELPDVKTAVYISGGEESLYTDVPLIAKTGSLCMKKSIGTISIIVENPDSVAKVNDYLSNFGELILGRIGIPHRPEQLGIISIIVEGTPDQLGSLAGKLGMLDGVKTKSMIMKK